MDSSNRNNSSNSDSNNNSDNNSDINRNNSSNSNNSSDNKSKCSLWDRLPPEIQEQILWQAVYLHASENPLKVCHQQIVVGYRYDNNQDFNWPMPSRMKRCSEQGEPVHMRKDQFGCERYYRGVYYITKEEDGRTRTRRLKNDMGKTIYCVDVTLYVLHINKLYTCFVLMLP